jgi:manganese/zinc/iron transport system ATP- binding protein
MVPALDIEDLTVAYQESPVLWDLDLSVPQGVIQGIVGPNGAGKSTLIKTVLNLIPRAAGQIEILGKSYNESKHLLAYVPQRNSVDWDFPTTVLDVAMMGSYGRLGWFKRPGKKEREEAHQALERVGLADYAHRQISQLSGGQQQRTFLARALMENAMVYLMDEPFQGVDAKTERAIITLLQELRKQGKTVLVVHHDLQTVESYFDRVTFLNVKHIVSGPVSEVFTKENIIKTYGGAIDMIAPKAG